MELIYIVLQGGRQVDCIPLLALAQFTFSSVDLSSLFCKQNIKLNTFNVF